MSLDLGSSLSTGRIECEIWREIDDIEVCHTESKNLISRLECKVDGGSVGSHPMKGMLCLKIRYSLRSEFQRRLPSSPIAPRYGGPPPATTMPPSAATLSQIDDRIGRLTDAYIDRLIEQELFEARKKTLLSERLDLQSQIASWQDGKRDASKEVAKFIELADGACLAFNNGTLDEKRDLLDALTSDRLIDGEIPVIVLSLPFRTIAERPKGGYGVPRRGIHQIWKPLLARLSDIVRGQKDYQNSP